MLAEIWQWTPFMVLIFLAGLRSLPREPYEAAMIDGGLGLADVPPPDAADDVAA